MVKKLFFLFATFFFLLPQTSIVLASENPLSHPNNKFGIHILFPTELQKAAKLVNSNGGQWGYVVIPLQSGDRDMAKWQSFLDEAGRRHVIPIIRLATEGDYFNTTVWRTPTDDDIIDFANFLNSLTWPTKNRYVILFNEVNRADEWGGSVDPTAYAKLLSYAVSVFKSKSQDFFLLNAGLDNGAPDNLPDFMNEYTYLQAMNTAVPGIFHQIDGFDSHSYPNPGFSEPPSVITSKSIGSFRYERSLLASFGVQHIPIFITETGWRSDAVTSALEAKYYQEAFSGSWSDADIAVVAPFLLDAGSGPFRPFSFLKADGSETAQYLMYSSIPKIEGKPSLTQTVLSAASEAISQASPTLSLPERNFSAELTAGSRSFSVSKTMETAFRWIMKI